MSEYGMTFEQAMATPLARAFGLMCCHRKRNGGKFAAPDYKDSDFIMEAKRVERHP